ncbi:Thiamine transporter THI72 [Talaromyces pinophilus]|nr:Thiamine transporter THI72 [Talaromyces pinophilus]
MGFLRSVNAALILRGGSEVASHWRNPDLVPMPVARRTWRDLDFVGLWSTAFVTIFGWQGVSALLSMGLSVWQAIVCNFVAKLIQIAVVLSLGWIGAVWHIGFTVNARQSFGLWGSYVPLLMRIMLCCVWFGVQGITGGQIVSTLLSTIFSSYQHMPNTLPASANMTTKEFVGFVIFNIICIPFLYIPPDKLRVPFRYSLAISAVTLIAMSIGLMAAAGGAGPLVHTGTTATSGSKLGWAWIDGITTVIGGTVVGSTSQCDFSRFARRPGNQFKGQIFALLFFGNVIPVFGLLGTSAASALYGDVTELNLWNPPSIIQLWLDRSYDSPKMRVATFFVSLGLVCSMVAINTVENGISGGMDAAGLLPKYINIRRGSYFIMVISVVIQPWQITAKASTFTSVLSSFGDTVILGPLIAVFTCDYFFVRHQRVKLTDLYNPSSQSIYWFWHGVNWRGFVSWIVGAAPFLPGLASLNPSTANTIPIGLTEATYTGFLCGYVISFGLHYLINKVFPPDGAGLSDEVDTFGTFSDEEAEKLGVLKLETASEYPNKELTYS